MATFQSYQGSILTYIMEKYGEYILDFQSYQGSILTTGSTRRQTKLDTFNPIKVRF